MGVSWDAVKLPWASVRHREECGFNRLNHANQRLPDGTRPECRYGPLWQVHRNSLHCREFGGIQSRPRHAAHWLL